MAVEPNEGAAAVEEPKLRLELDCGAPKLGRAAADEPPKEGIVDEEEPPKLGAGLEVVDPKEGALPEPAAPNVGTATAELLADAPKAGSPLEPEEPKARGLLLFEVEPNAGVGAFAVTAPPNVNVALEVDVPKLEDVVPPNVGATVVVVAAAPKGVTPEEVVPKVVLLFPKVKGEAVAELVVEGPNWKAGVEEVVDVLSLFEVEVEDPNVGVAVWPKRLAEVVFVVACPNRLLPELEIDVTPPKVTVLPGDDFLLPSSFLAPPNRLLAAPKAPKLGGFSDAGVLDLAATAPKTEAAELLEPNCNVPELAEAVGAPGALNDASPNGEVPKAPAVVAAGAPEPLDTAEVVAPPKLKSEVPAGLDAALDSLTAEVVLPNENKEVDDAVVVTAEGNVAALAAPPNANKDGAAPLLF